MADQPDISRELEEARATIAAQAVQIHRLEQEASQGSGTDAIREILELSDVVGTTVGEAPFRALLEGILVAARRLFDAEAGSILLLDAEANELVFEAASGGADVLGMRIPAHKGIAGWVVMTGEPIASSDVRRDPRWAKDFAQSVGYIPQSILAVPMISGEDVVGVIEVLDKHAGASFGLNDMELLGLFAQPAAIAVEQAQKVTSVGKLLVAELGRLAAEKGSTQISAAVSATLEAGVTTPDATLELARLVHRLSRKGERARTLATEILTAVDRYTSPAPPS